MGLTVATIVLDTNIVLYFLGGRLEHPLPDGSYAVSVISELELLAYPDLTTSEGERVKAFLADIAVIPGDMTY
jgi:predicted nucleic acid-binding protein